MRDYEIVWKERNIRNSKDIDIDIDKKKIRSHTIILLDEQNKDPR